jgi:restriction endonuclease S subunit
MSEDRALPAGWRTLRFDEFAKSIVERVNPGEADEDIYVGLEHLDPESLKIQRWGTPADVVGEKLRFRAGDVIFGRRRFYQRKVAVAEFDGICSAHAMVLRARDDVMLQSFLPFFLQSQTFFQRAMQISVGSLSPTINWRALARQEFVVPPLDEQQRIAEILWAAEAVVDGWQRVHEALGAVSTSVRDEIICAPAHPRRPLADCLIGIVPGRSVVGVNEPAAQNERGVLKVSAVGPKGFEANENKRLLDPSNFMPIFQVRAGDLLMTRANTRELVGRVCIVPRDYCNLMLCDKTLRLDVREDVAIKGFLEEVLLSGQLRMQIEAAASGTGGAMKNISQDRVRRLRIPLPEIDSQTRIAAYVRNIRSVRESVEAHLQQSTACKKALLERLLVEGVSDV